MGSGDSGQSAPHADITLRAGLRPRAWPEMRRAAARLFIPRFGAYTVARPPSLLHEFTDTDGPTAADDSKPATMTQDLTPERIVIVDDQERNLQVLTGILEPLGFEITPFTSGEKAVGHITGPTADLILLDVMMPEMDGFEVCRRIRAQPELLGVPIIFLSAADEKAFVVRALEAGAVDYVTKPFNQAELISRVRTHLALKRARDRLKQLAEDKDELLGILAHDLKNHLGGMQMTARLLHERTEGLSDARLTRMATNIVDASNQMFSFVKEFLANAAADRGLTLSVEAVSVAEAAAATVQRYSEAALRKSIRIHEDFPADAPMVLADRGALDQVIENLLSNALKFSPPDTSIWLSIAPTQDGFLEFRVRDEGPGCDANDLARMFTRYRRLSARPTAGEPSTGLGLSIAKRHADAMKGSLACVSEGGHGSTFILRLPLAR
jgi:two-component system, sensor histidine kinase and response regulator